MHCVRPTGEASVFFSSLFFYIPPKTFYCSHLVMSAGSGFTQMLRRGLFFFGVYHFL
jgi:hypothetical protein